MAAQEETPKSQPETETQTETEQNPEPQRITVDLFKLITSARSHGAESDDFDVYRRFLSRKLAELRKALNLQSVDPQNDKKTQRQNAKKNKEKRKTGKFGRKRPPDWNPKYKLPRIQKVCTWRRRVVSAEDVARSGSPAASCLLFESERAWAFSRSLYEEYDEDHHRKYHHSNCRLRKAVAHADAMEKVLAPICRPLTALQCAAYSSWLRSSYFLQREQLHDALRQYLRWRALSEGLAMALCLENGDGAAVRDKMAYFNESIDGATRAEIEEEVAAEVEAIKSKIGWNEQSAASAENAADGEGKEVVIEFGPHRVSVPKAASLRALVGQFQTEKAALSKSKKAARSLPNLTAIVVIAEKALSIVQKESAKFTTSSNLSEGANAYLVTERALNFERLRFTVCRQSLWMDRKLKRGGLARDHRLLFELATLSERIMTDLDEMAGVLDLSEYVAFERQRDLLRRRFEISRNYHIAQLLFHSKRQYVAAIQVLEVAVTERARTFIERFGDGKGAELQSEGGTFDVSAFIDLPAQCQAVKTMLRGSKRLILMAKANAVLKGGLELNDQQNKQKVVEPSLVSMKREMMPILSKPVMMDMAWHFVDYHDVLDAESTKKPTDSEKESVPAQSKRQSSWFGGLFGQ